MEKKNYKTKEEVLTDLIKSQDDLYNEMKDTDGILIEKSKLDKLFELNNFYKNFDKK